MNTQLAQTSGNLDLVLQSIEHDPELADSTKEKYRRAVLRYAGAGHSLTNPKDLARYARNASASERAFLSAAVTRLTEAIEREAKGQATPENVTKQQKGTKAHTWLSQIEVKRLLDTCDDGIVGQRDRLALGLLVAAGLRRREAAELRFDDVMLQPSQGKMRTVLDVRGKGAKDRVVPISDRLANAIDEWTAVVGYKGRVLRSLGRDRKPGDSITPTGLYYLVRRRGEEIGKPNLAPHDLRRTFAQLGYEAGVPVTQISRLLGHASIETTQRYLNLDLDLETTVSDFIPF
jgi:integrase